MTVRRRRILAAGAMLPFLATGCATRPGATPEQRAAIAPTGTLRLGVNFGSPLSLVRNPAGEARGVLYDLARGIADWLAVPLQVAEFRSVPDLVAAMKAGQLDLTGTNATPARAAELDFTKTVIELELGYLVPAGSTLQDAEDAKRPGVKIGVAQGSTSQAVLPRTLPQATIVPVAGLTAVGGMLRSGALDAFTTNKAVLFEISDTVPGSRVLPGSWGKEHWALALPKGRGAGVQHLESFLARARAYGAIRAAVERSGLRGATLV